MTRMTLLLTLLVISGAAQAHDTFNQACPRSTGIQTAPYRSAPYSRVSVFSSQPGAILQTTTITPIITSTYNVKMPLPGTITTPATGNGAGYIPGVISTPAGPHGPDSIPGVVISPANSGSMILVPPGTY